MSNARNVSDIEVKLAKVGFRDRTSNHEHASESVFLNVPQEVRAQQKPL